MNKKEARKKYLNIRKEIDASLRKTKSSKICDELISLIKNYDAILLYAPLEAEADVFPLLEKAPGDVFFPRVNGDDMTFFLVKNESDLKVGNFNVREPKSDCKQIEFDKNKKYICIVPGVAFDKRGYRIGYGKGYYDRFLKEHSEYDIYTVGVCFKECYLEHIEEEAHDMKVDMVITD